jgi:hypothetical protein
MSGQGVSKLPTSVNPRVSRRLDGRSAVARRIKTLVATYAAQIGRCDEATRTAVRAIAELQAWVEVRRAALNRGEQVDMDRVLRCEGVIARKMGRLGLVVGKPRQPPARPASVRETHREKMRQAMERST